MKFVCHACAARYYIDDAKVAGKVLSIRCKRCSAMIAVRDPALPAAHAPVGARRATQSLAAVTHAHDAHADEHVQADEAEVEAWHYSINGETFGPYSEDELVARYQSGTIGDETYVWRPGYTEWLPAIEVPVFESAIEAGRTQRQRRGTPRTQNLDLADVLSALSAAGPSGAPAVVATDPGGALSTTLREAPTPLETLEPTAPPMPSTEPDASIAAPEARLSANRPADGVDDASSATPAETAVAPRVWPADAPTIEQTAPPSAEAPPEADASGDSTSESTPIDSPAVVAAAPASVGEGAVRDAAIAEFGPHPQHDVPLSSVRRAIPAAVVRAEPDPQQFLPTAEEQERLSFGAIALTDHGHAPLVDSHHGHHEPAPRGSKLPIVIGGLIAAVVIGAVVWSITRPEPIAAVADGTLAAAAAASGTGAVAGADAGLTDVEPVPRAAPSAATVQVAVLRTSRVVANAFVEARESAAAIASQGAVTNAVSALRYVEEPTVILAAAEEPEEADRRPAVASSGHAVTAVAPPSPGRVALPTATARGTQGIYGQLGSSAAAPVPTVDPSLAEPEAASGPSAEHFANGLRTFVESSIQRCHQRQVTEEGSMPAARVEVELTVQPNGRVSEVSVGRQLFDTTFDRCLQGHRERWSFGPFAGEAVTLQKTYVLQ